MKISKNQSRRNFISFIGMAPFLSGLMNGIPDLNLSRGSQISGKISLPCPELFPIKGTYLNAAYTHPLSIASANAVNEYISFRLMNGKAQGNFMTDWDGVKALYAGLINAEPDEIAWIPSTMAGENIIVNGLGIPGSKARIVTDALHFDGSLYMYSQLEKTGVDVRIVMPESNRISLDQMDEAIKPGTKLVAVSLVSMVNGFQHDLKALCEIAHSRGALVYADVIQAVGTVPFDAHDCKVDFCAASSFKWLMGDFGAGFLYVSKEIMPLLHRSQYGYRQVVDLTSHWLPFDPPGETPYNFSAGNSAGCYFEVGSLANESVIALSKSLGLIREIGVESIAKYRQPMLRMIQTKLPSLGFMPLTPEDSTSPIVSFAYKDAQNKLAPKLKKADINIQLYDNRIRISPSIYNSPSDIENLIDELSKT
jgi:selenocysteine lyase/cysteine desulfurase